MTVGAPQILVQRLNPDAVIPGRAHEDDGGLDLAASEPVLLAPGQRAVVPTGVAVAVPAGYVGLVCPRSGLAARHGVGVVNGPGVIDAGYRGEVRVVLVNHDRDTSVQIRQGDRIAQLVIVPVVLGEVVEVDQLGTASRNAAGFGSTGGFLESTSEA